MEKAVSNIIRLDRYLSNSGIGTRTEVRKMINKGIILVNGKIAESGEIKVNTETDSVTVNNRVAEYKEFVYLMMNKPAGYITATEDNRHNTVIDLVPEEYTHFKLSSAGRLDIDTEGLLLLTNDGDFVHKIISPKNKIKKKYYAELDFPIEDKDIELFKSGVILDDGYKTLPAELKSAGNGNSVYITITEGKFHQIKRMFKAVNKNVIYLKRMQIGTLILDNTLKKGEVRELNNIELNNLKEQVEEKKHE